MLLTKEAFYEGKIISFFKEKGTGFIQPSWATKREDNIFFHVTRIKNCFIENGKAVVFKIDTDPRGRRMAIDIIDKAKISDDIDILPNENAERPISVAPCKEEIDDIPDQEEIIMEILGGYSSRHGKASRKEVVKTKKGKSGAKERKGARSWRTSYDLDDDYDY